MYELSSAKRVHILNMLVEGMSMRATSRVAEISINTVAKLMIEAGEACAAYHDESVRNVEARKVQCDEIWAFFYAEASTPRKRTSRKRRPRPRVSAMCGPGPRSTATAR